MNTRIKKVRDDHFLTQEEFASHLKISKSSVSLLESGRNKPSKQTVAMICDKFNVSLEWLETGEGYPYIKKESEYSLAEEIRDLTKGENPLMAAVLSSLAQMPPQWWDEWSKKLHEEAERIKKKEGV